MTPIPNPEALITDAVNAMFPVLTIIIGVGLGLALITMITDTIKKAVRVDEAPYVAVHPVRTPVDQWFEDEDLEDQGDDDPEDLYGLAPVQCPRCNGVTELAGAVGRCKYCGTPLSADGSTRLTGYEPIIKREN